MKLLRSLAIIAAAMVSCYLPAAAGTTGNLTGYVKDTSGHPVADVRVDLASPSYATTAQTNNAGFYAFSGVPADTYTISFSKPGFAAQSLPGITIVQDQSITQNATLQPQLKTIVSTRSTAATSLVQPQQTADQVVVTPQMLQNITGTPMTVEQSQVLRALPGFTAIASGAPSIRGGAVNDLGYEMEGVDIKEPVLGLFTNNGALAGTQQLTVTTGSFDVAQGNSNEGIINEVIKTGRYPGFFNLALFDDAGYFYNGLAAEAGGGTQDGKFTWYAAYHGVKDANVIGNGQFQPLAVGGTSNVLVNESVLNLFYHWGQNNRNQLQYFGETGYNTYDYNWLINPAVTPYPSANQLVWASLAGGNCNYEGGPTVINCGQLVANTLPLFPGQYTQNENTNYPDNENNYHSVQKIEWQHQFSSSSFFSFQLSRAFEFDNYDEPWAGGAFNDYYLHNASNNYGFTFTYDNQISEHHDLTFGAATVDEQTGYDAQQNDRAAFTFFNDWCYVTPIKETPQFGCGSYGTGVMNTFPNVEYLRNDPIHRNYAYIRDRWQPSGRWFFNLGLRWDNQRIALPANAASLGDLLNYDGGTGDYIQTTAAPIGSLTTNPSQISPRMFGVYQMGLKDVLRFGWGRYVDFPTELQTETKVVLPASLLSCNVANGCFSPLPGYGVTNNVTNLYQQSLYDFNTYFNSQYSPTEPQYTTDTEFSWEHDYGHGWQTKLTPYYRKGTNYIVGSQPIIQTLASGAPLYGPYTFSNLGVIQSTGVELSLQKQQQYGLSGWVNATYDNTMANYNSDYIPELSYASIALNHFYHVSYAAPFTATFGLDYNTKGGFHLITEVPYESGYWYGVGKMTFIYESFYPNGQEAPLGGPGTVVLPVQVPNTNYLNGAYGYYTVDPQDPGTYEHPNIIGSKGTPEGNDPGSLRAPGQFYVNLTLAQDFGPQKQYQVGVRFGNLFGNFAQALPVTNPWYHNNGFGGYNSNSGLNGNAGYEPYQYNLTPGPYVTEEIGPERQILFFITSKV